MTFLDKLERRFGRLRIPNLMFYIVIAMGSVYLIDLLFARKFAEVGGLFYDGMTGFLAFDRAAILSGQVWRLISFIIIPPESSLIFIIFALYFYYLIGRGLESAWGSFKFGLFYFCGILGTIAAGFLTGYAVNTYLNLSLFFAFAIFYPNFEVRLFFLIPVKIKWLAWLDAALYAVLFFLNGWSGKAAILFALGNLFLFFGKRFCIEIRDLFRRTSARIKYKRSLRQGGRQNQNYWKNR